MAERRAQRGFTLLEVLVAFVIASLGIAALFDAATSSLLTATVAARYEEAMSRAQSHLAGATHGAPSEAVTQSGEEGDGFRWSVRIGPLAIAPPRRAEPPSGASLAPLALYAVEVTESWRERGREREVRLTGRRIGLAPQ